MNATYDTIGINYAHRRRPDPRIAAVLKDALGPATSILNVGAGAGSYESADRPVTALEPSAAMIRQRPASAAKVVQGRAEELPFGDKTFGASMAVLTVHHWTDQEKGLREMRRVTRGPVVLLTYDPTFRGFWLADYIPALVALDEKHMPRMELFEACLGPVRTRPVAIPADCTDGFLCAYWQRPAAYLDPKVRSAISSFWKVGDISEPLARLESDLHSGAWALRNASLLGLTECDCGYRLVVSP